MGLKILPRYIGILDILDPSNLPNGYLVCKFESSIPQRYPRYQTFPRWVLHLEKSKKIRRTPDDDDDDDDDEGGLGGTNFSREQEPSP